MQALYLIDFDGTLFNSDKFHTDIALFLQNKLGVELSFILEAYKETKAEGKPHHLKKHLEILRVQNIKELQKEVAIYLLSLGNDYLYSDTLQFLNKFSHQFLIYTFAKPDHYKLKLKVSRLNKFRLPTLMIEDNKNEYLAKNLTIYKNMYGLGLSRLYPKVYWIDDKIDSFNQNIEGVEFIRIRREGDKYSFEPTPRGVREISTLLELI